jgi:hypothetical protein
MTHPCVLSWSCAAAAVSSAQSAVRSLAVHKAAAEAAVAASEKTGRPVNTRVKKLAESR